MYWPDSTRMHYLFGTMHTSSPASLNQFELVKKWLSHCSVFIAETDLSGPMPSFTGVWKQDLKLALGENFYDRVASKLRQLYGIDLQMMRFTHPLHVMSFISQHMIGEMNTEALDFLLQREADRLQMETGGLETIDEQLQILINLPESQSLLQLKKLLRNLSGTRRQLIHMDETYARGDIRKLYKMSRKGLGGHRHIHINQRNAILSKRVLNYLEPNERSHFICCGAAHLWGEFGMLRSLKKAGLLLKPIIV